MANPKLRTYAAFQLSTTAVAVIKADAGTLHSVFSGIGLNEQPASFRMWLYDNAASATGTCIVGREVATSNDLFEPEVDFANGLVLKVVPLTGTAGSLTIVYS